MPSLALHQTPPMWLICRIGTGILHGYLLVAMIMVLTRILQLARGH